MIGAMPPDFVVGKPLPEHPNFSSDKTARAFWRLSYRCGRDYRDGLDSHGEPILIKHEREKEDAYRRRKRIAKPHNHCGPILRRYNDFVFRTPAVRAEASEGSTYAMLLADADGHGTSLETFMRRALLKAAIDREVYLLPDSNRRAEDAAMTMAQARERGVRPYLRTIDADCVVWWRDRDGCLCEAVALMEDDAGKTFARYYTERFSQDIQLRKTDGISPIRVIDSIGSEAAHSYRRIPLVRLRPLFDTDEQGSGESQISPLAELQHGIFNFLSLHSEELYGNTYSQMVLTGVSASEVKDAEVGNSRLLCVPNAQAKLEVIGGDPAQAATITARIEGEQRELYRIAGITTGDPTAGPGNVESGIAKAFRFNDLAANLSALADATEDAENAAVAAILTAQGEDIPDPAQYPNDFDLPDLAADLEMAIRAAASPLPQILKAKVVQRFADRNVQLDDAEKTALAAELANPPESEDPFNPARRMTGS